MGVEDVDGQPCGETAEEDARAEEVPDRLCPYCRTNDYVEGYPTALCEQCRQGFIEHPVPRWLWVFGIGILIVMIAGSFGMPAYLAANVGIERADRAMADHRYLSAQRTLWGLRTDFPDNIEVNGRLFVTGVRNWDQLLIAEMYGKIIGRFVDDDALYTRVTNAMGEIDATISVDSVLVDMIEARKHDVVGLYGLFLQRDSIDGVNHVLEGTMIATKVYDRGDYDVCERILQRVLERDSTYYGACTLMAAVKRNLSKCTEGLALCDRMLERNREDVGVIAQKARISLRCFDDLSAVIYAREAMETDSGSVLAWEAQAMADFFNDRKERSRTLLNHIRERERATGDSTISTRLAAIIDGTVYYR